MQAVIKSSPEWAWANNAVSQQPMKEAIEKLEEAVAGHPFTKIFLTMAVADVKKTYSDEAVMMQCGSMSQLLDPLVRDVIKETSTMVNMHAARSKAA